MKVTVLAPIPVQTGLLAWLEARGVRTLRSIEADLRRIDARLGLNGARFVPLDADRDDGAHVSVNRPRLIGMRE